MPTHPYSYNVAQALSQIRDEDQIWDEITAQVNRQLKELLEGILECERDQVVACLRYQRDKARGARSAGQGCGFLSDLVKFRLPPHFSVFSIFSLRYYAELLV